MYWEAPNGVWHGPLTASPAGQVLSTPSLALTSQHLAVVSVQGPNNSLQLYWEAANGRWHGPLGLAPGGTTLSAPALTLTPTNLADYRRAGALQQSHPLRGRPQRILERPTSRWGERDYRLDGAGSLRTPASGTPIHVNPGPGVASDPRRPCGRAAWTTAWRCPTR